MNTAIVSRAQISDQLGVMSLNGDIFAKDDFNQKYAFKTYPQALKRVDYIQKKVKSWADHTGVSIGAINFRRAAADSLNDLEVLATSLGNGKEVDYAVQKGKPDVVLYAKPDAILKSGLFKLLTKMAEGQNENAGPAQKLLAKATVEMMKTLLNKIPEEKWMEVQKDPILRELTQNALFRLSQHLATSVNQVGHFRNFSQAIDRAHAELTTLLLLYMPFEKESFENRFRELIQPLFPQSLQPTLVGIGKSAMNIFAGINAAVMESHPGTLKNMWSTFFIMRSPKLLATRLLWHRLLWILILRK